MLLALVRFISGQSCRHSCKKVFFKVTHVKGIGAERAFGPLNGFVYISQWASRVNSQNRPHFECDYRN